MNDLYPGGQPSGPVYGQRSPDGRYWWDGHNWLPTQPPGRPQPGHPQGPPQPHWPGPAGVPPRSSGLPTAVKVLLGVVGLGVVGFVALVAVGVAVGASDDPGDTSCADLAERAVRMSADNDKMITLLGVSDLSVVEDHRDDYSTPSSGRATVLSCRGTADWDTISDSPVVLEMAVDSDGEPWVSYQIAPD